MESKLLQGVLIPVKPHLHIVIIPVSAKHQDPFTAKADQMICRKKSALYVIAIYIGIIFCLPVSAYCHEMLIVFE